MLCCSFFIFPLANAQNTTYEVPISSNSIATNIPEISDDGMVQCIEIFNEAKWLKEELDNVQVNISLPESVNAYNSKASHYSQLADYFNINCAGKQSEPAVRVTQKLNQLKTQ